jgi:outer membrane immunogenic protein
MRHTRQKLLVTTAVLAFSATAYAADMPVKAAPPVAPVAPVVNWTGFYVGGQLGGASMNGSCSQTNNSPFAFPTGDGLVPCSVPSASGMPSAESFVGGGKIGYDFQFGKVVLGLVGDWNWADLNSSFQSGGPTSSIARASTKIDWLASFRGRIGWAFDNVLFYGTGGVAWAHVKDSASFTGTCCGNWASQSTTTATGAVAGGGFEYRVSQNVSVVGELLWYGNFKSSSTIACKGIGDTEGGPLNTCFGGTQTYTTNFNSDVVLGTLGVNWRF